MATPSRAPESPTFYGPASGEAYPDDFNAYDGLATLIKLMYRGDLSEARRQFPLIEAHHGDRHKNNQDG